MEITNNCVVALTWTMKDTLGEELDVLDEPVGKNRRVAARP
jgi:FKBP-type peptidyl-prolyl cis-trans isomerase SlyD